MWAQCQTTTISCSEVSIRHLTFLSFLSEEKKVEILVGRRGFLFGEKGDFGGENGVVGEERGKGRRGFLLGEMRI